MDTASIENNYIHVKLSKKKGLYSHICGRYMLPDRHVHGFWSDSSCPVNSVFGGFIPGACGRYI
jgi:hypothetical protein